MQVYAYTFKNELTSLCWNYLGDVQNELDKFYDLGLDGYFADYPNTVSFFLLFFCLRSLIITPFCCLVNIRGATAGKAPRFWVSIRSYKKQLIKNIWGRILGIAWLKFAMVPLNIKPSFIVNFLKCVKIDQGLNVTTNKKATIQNLDYFLRTDMAKEYFKNY